MFTHWLQQQFAIPRLSSPRKSGRRSRAVPCRPQLEALEDRVVPATVTWVRNAFTGFLSGPNTWSNPANWANNRFPLNGDDIVFPDNPNLDSTSVNDLTGRQFNSLTIEGNAAFDDDYLISGVGFSLAAGGIDVTGLVDISPEIRNDITLAGTAAKPIDVGTGSSLSLTGRISGTGGLTKTGDGILHLARPAGNTYTGRTAVADGTVRMLSHASLGASGGAADDTVVSAGANVILDLSSFAPFLPVQERVTISGTFSSSRGALHATGSRVPAWVGTVTLSTSDPTISVANGSLFTIAGLITGPGGLRKFDTGTLRLGGSASNNFVGRTFVSAGTLELDKSSGLAVPGRLDIGNSDPGNNNLDVVRLLRNNQVSPTSTFNIRKSGLLDLQTFSQGVGTLSMNGGKVVASGSGTGRGRLVLNGNVIAATDIDHQPAIIFSRLDLNGGQRTFTVSDDPSAAVELRLDNSSILTGSGTLIKQGPGRLFLGGTSTSGSVRLDAGTVEIAANYGSSPFTVNGGRLTGSGTVSTLAVNPGGFIAPDVAVNGNAFVQPLGVLSVINTVTFQDGATIVLKVIRNNNGQLEFNQLRHLGQGTVALNGVTLLNEDSILNGSIAPITLVENRFGNTTGFLRYQEELIDGDTDEVVERTPFTFDALFPPNENGIPERRFLVEYSPGGSGNVQLVDASPAARDLALTPNPVRAGEEVALTGSLTSADLAADLVLLINWGDGSPTEVHRPGREPFRFTHTYAGRPEGGRFTVNASWFDGFGFGNRRTIEVVVEGAPLPPQDAIASVDPTGLSNPAALTWYLRSDHSSGAPDAGSFSFGALGWKGVLGDWDGNGSATVGAVDVTGAGGPFATWYLRNANSSGAPDVGPFAFGSAGWVPLAGDWDGDGVDGIGMVDPGTATWYLRNAADAGPPDVILVFGLPGWVPVVGDWDGDGTDTVGMVDPTSGTWYLARDNVAGTELVANFAFGGPGWQYVVGDWDGDGTDTAGVVDPNGMWFLRNSNNAGSPDTTPFTFGLGSWVPLAGRIPGGPEALRLADGALPPADVPTLLTDQQLDVIVSAALDRLAGGGVDPLVIGELARAEYRVAPLAPGVLGLADATARRVWLSADAAGQGWYVDPTPPEDAEYAGGLGRPGTGAEAGVDLLSAVLHEMGHLGHLGHGASGLMAEVLGPGRRDLSALDAAFAPRAG